MINDLPDGLYFELPEELYHALPRLSSSGIKDLKISRSIFWAKSWMNPNREREETEAMKIGTAFHSRILCGEQEFYKQYAPHFDPSGFADALVTVEHLKAHLRFLGLPLSGNKDELIKRVTDANPEAVILDNEKAKYEAANSAKTLIGQNWINKIEMAQAFISRHPDLSKCFKGGYPEVSILWTEQDIKMKSRLDYLKPKAMVDLKTFANKSNKPIDAAIYAAMASEKYHIQAATYWRARKAAYEFAEVMLQANNGVEGTLDNNKRSFLKKFVSTIDSEFFFVFQLKHEVPLARGKKFIKGRMFQIGESIINDAIEEFKYCIERFGECMWIEEIPINSFDDDLFPIWATEL